MIELLIGPIASGKSTYAKTKARFGDIVINDDDIVNAVHANEYDLYSKPLKNLYKSIEHTIFMYAISLRKNVIIDKPNHRRDTRVRWVQLAKAYDCDISYILFKHEDYKIHAKRRYESDSRGYTLKYWEDVAKHHQDLFQGIVEEEGYTRLVKTYV